MILGVFTELMGTGGVQRVSVHSAAALVRFASRQDRPVRLLSLNDPVGEHDLRVADDRVAIVGFGRSRARLIAAALSAVPRTGLMYIGHPNLAPLGIVARLVRPQVRYCVATYGVEVWERLPAPRRLALRWARIVTAISDFSAERLITVQGLRGRPAVISPALDPILARNGKRPSPPALPAGRIVLTVARLTTADSYKGVDHVIQALPAVLNMVPDTCYVVVGDGDDRRRLEGLATQLGVRDHVIFAGTPTDELLAGYYEACDVFVMPSRGEGFGIVYVEAMSHGKPVVAADRGAAPEVVEDGVTGMLVDYGNVSALAAGVARLLTDGDGRHRMGEAGRRRVEERYTFERFQARLEALLVNAAR
jgi:glycosyltransferase involved in cell wall biosynthesis